MTDARQEETAPTGSAPWALAQLRALHGHALAHPQLKPPRDADGEQFLARLDRAVEALAERSPDYEYAGREALVTVQSHYPDLWPVVDRRLLYFFGGDCLHFLGDEEIDAFQAEIDAADGDD